MKLLAGVIVLLVVGDLLAAFGLFGGLALGAALLSAIAAIIRHILPHTEKIL